MASYNIYDNEERPLRDRFLSVSDEVGQDEFFVSSLVRWRETFVSSESLPTEVALADLLSDLKGIQSLVPRTTFSKHRLFVSHRQIDKKFGLRIANLAHNNGFEFWLDVLNPILTSLSALTHLSLVQKALLTACVIEIGLINSTHVLAVMTRKTKGGEWVPYEYGRVRQINNTASWKHPHHKFVLPEYMDLGAITTCEADIDNWLSSFSPSYSSISWRWSATIPLP